MRRTRQAAVLHIPPLVHVADMALWTIVATKGRQPVVRGSGRFGSESNPASSRLRLKQATSYWH